MNGPTKQRKVWRALLVITAITAMFAFNACEFAQTKQYNAKSEGLGVRINFLYATTNQLQLLSTVASVTNPDAALRHNGITNVSCGDMWGNRLRGDQCAFRVVRAIKVSGGLADAYRHLWEAAIDGPELFDFRDDSMAYTRQNSNRCISVYVGWSLKADWSYRNYSTSGNPCGIATGTGGGGGGSWVKQRHAPSRAVLRHFRPTLAVSTKARAVQADDKPDQATGRILAVGGGGGGSW